jgi:hypothetical protein
MLQERKLVTISQLEKLFLKETGLVAPYFEARPADDQPPRAAREEIWRLWVQKYTSALD